MVYLCSGLFDILMTTEYVLTNHPHYTQSMTCGSSELTLFVKGNWGENVLPKEHYLVALKFMEDHKHTQRMAATLRISCSEYRQDSTQQLVPTLHTDVATLNTVCRCSVR